MLKKWILPVVACAGLTLLVGSTQLHANVNSKYYTDKSKAQEHALDVKEPNGQAAKFTSVAYSDNHSADPSKFKKVNDLRGVRSDADVAQMGGKVIMKKLMSYEDYYDLGITSSLRYDIDPNRMVWVIQTTFNEKTFNGVLVKNPTVTALYDAQSGDMISVHVSSPYGMPRVNRP